MKKSIRTLLIGVFLLGMGPIAIDRASRAQGTEPSSAETGVSSILDQIRAEQIDGNACGSPPGAPGEISNKSAKRFSKAVESWDRCQRSRINGLEDRVVDYQYQLDNWLPELSPDDALVERAYRTINIYNRRVARARERSEKDYAFLASAEADYADRVDTAIRQETWGRITWEQRISDLCMTETTVYLRPFSETLYQCIARKKYEQGLIEAGYRPYTPYDPYPLGQDYDRIKINVTVHVDEGGHGRARH